MYTHMQTFTHAGLSRPQLPANGDSGRPHPPQPTVRLCECNHVVPGTLEGRCAYRLTECVSNQESPTNRAIKFENWDKKNGTIRLEKEKK